MDEIDLRGVIIPTKLENTPLREGVVGNIKNKILKNNNIGKYTTYDFVYLNSRDETAHYFPLNKLEKGSSEAFLRRTHPTDYAKTDLYYDYKDWTIKANGACDVFLRSSDHLYLSKKQPCYNEVDVIGSSGFFYTEKFNNKCGIRPAMRLSVESVVRARKLSKDLFKINTVTSDLYTSDLENGLSPKVLMSSCFGINEFNPIPGLKQFPNILYHTIEFGEFPKSFVGYVKDAKWKDKEAIKTGRIYSSANGVNEEYEIDGEFYVKALIKSYRGRWSDSDKHSDILYHRESQKFDDGTYIHYSTKAYREEAWFKVEPITFIINNWDELPREINPYGNGMASFIDVTSENAIMAKKFFPHEPSKHLSKKEINKCALWQNSHIRGYLNDIYVDEIKDNGNPEAAVSGSGYCQSTSFLKEAMRQRINYKQPKSPSNKSGKIEQEQSQEQELER